MERFPVHCTCRIRHLRRARRLAECCTHWRAPRASSCCSTVHSASVRPWRSRRRRRRGSPAPVTCRGVFPHGKRRAGRSSTHKKGSCSHRLASAVSLLQPAARFRGTRVALTKCGDVPHHNSKMSVQVLPPSDPPMRDAPDFSLVLGGPLFQLLRRGRLASDAMTLVARRCCVFVLITWVPLLVLSALDGHLIDGGVTVPFLTDVETHVRFLIVVPPLLAAELVVHRRLLPIARSFLDRELIPEDAMPRFNAAISSALRLRNSAATELFMLGFVYAVGVLVVWR